jgi:5-formyltetrahydrofolate cyclo-ligase
MAKLDSKQELRSRMESTILAMSPAERMERGARAQARLAETPEFRAARSVMIYNSDATEIDTHELVLASLESGKRVGLPRTEKGSRVLQVLEILDVRRDLERSRFGFKEPLSVLPPIAPESLQLILVPGRAFDADGNRLGRGGGYYDRFIARLSGPRLVALAFDCQVVAGVPHEAHDRPVDMILTEERVIRTPRWRPTSDLSQVEIGP